MRLPHSVACPECEQPMAVVTATATEGSSTPVSVTYLCRTSDCGPVEYLVTEL